jgi:hypothetical protein
MIQLLAVVEQNIGQTYEYSIDITEFAHCARNVTTPIVSWNFHLFSCLVDDLHLATTLLCHFTLL